MLKEALLPIEYLRFVKETGSFAVHGAQETVNLVAKTVLDVLARAEGEIFAVDGSSDGLLAEPDPGQILEVAILTPQPPPINR